MPLLVNFTAATKKQRDPISHFCFLRQLLRSAYVRNFAPDSDEDWTEIWGDVPDQGVREPAEAKQADRDACTAGNTAGRVSVLAASQGGRPTGVRDSEAVFLFLILACSGSKQWSRRDLWAAITPPTLHLPDKVSFLCELLMCICILREVNFKWLIKRRATSSFLICRSGCWSGSGGALALDARVQWSRSGTSEREQDARKNCECGTRRAAQGVHR